MKKNKDKLEKCKSVATILCCLALTLAIVKSCVFGSAQSCLDTAIRIVSHIGGL